MQLNTQKDFIHSASAQCNVAQGEFYGGAGRGSPVKNVAPHFGPASLDFHLNRPVISLIQLHIVPPPVPLSWNCGPPIGPPIWLVPEPPLVWPEA